MPPGRRPEDEPDIIAIDGKTSRRSHDRRKGRNPLHLVSAWAARQRIVLGQQATEEKSNEITAIPLLLKHLDLKGALVTMDAMGTQTDIAHAIRDGGGDYCMSLKRNWPAVYADVEQCSTIRQTMWCSKRMRRRTSPEGGSKLAGIRSVIKSTG
jgi:predicted transposase YbfD/YdcC